MSQSTRTGLGYPYTLPRGSVAGVKGDRGVPTLEGKKPKTVRPVLFHVLNFNCLVERRGIMNKPKPLSSISPTSLRHNKARYQPRIEEEKSRQAALVPMPSDQPAPDYLTPEQRNVWTETLARMPAGALAVMDTSVLVGWCDLEVRRRARTLTPATWKLWLELAKACRLTPADRGKLSLRPPKPKVDNPFNQFV